nr:MFS transporter [uncultured Duganella sp.]
MGSFTSAFRRVWIGSAISQLGDVAFMLALPWLVLQTTGSSVALGSVMMALALPHALLMLVGGAVSDRFPVRTVLLAAYTAQALCVASIAVLLHIEALRLPALYLLAFCFGAADAFTSPALRVLLPQLVAPERLHGANAALQSSAQLCVLAGSALGGLLMARSGLPTMFAIDAASYACIIVVVLSLPNGRQVAAPASDDTGMRRAIADGLRYVWTDRALRALLIGFAGITFCSTGAIQIGLVVLAGARYGPSGLGWLMASAAAGSLLGLALAAKWPPADGVHARVAAVSVALGLLLAALALPMPLGWVCLDAALLGAAAGFVNVGVLGWLQGRVRADMLGRVMSVLGLASAGIAPLSLAAAGLLATYGTGALFAGAGGLLLLTTVALWRTTARRSAPV